MKTAVIGVLLLLFVGCSATQDQKKEVFQPLPSSLDSDVETASIEDYILALPPFANHEESVDSFASRVRRARTEEPKNEGKNLDYLFCGCDGTWPAKEFLLDRKTRTLKIRIFEWEADSKDYTETMRRVPGGWIRGPKRY